MKIRNLENEMEIRFWVLWVRLLKNRTALRTLGVICAVWVGTSLGLLVGIVVQLFFISGFSLAIQRLWTDTPAVQSVANGQENVLVILVDQLENEQPELRAAWLVLIHPSGSQLIFLPIYPSLQVGQNTLDTDLHRQFSLQADHSPSLAFLQALRNREMWWSYYLVMDEAALARMYALSFSVNDSTNRFASLAVSHLPLDWSKPQLALDGQARMVNQFCGQTGAVVQAMPFDKMLETLAGEYYTDLSNEQFQQSWGFLRSYTGNLYCEFPTLNESIQTVHQKD
jgi:hypothetical protein